MASLVYIKRVKGLRKYLPVFIIVIAVSTLWIIVFLYVLRPYRVEGFSMEPTLETGDYIIVFQHKGTFSRGDMIIFEHPEDKKILDVKRIWGLPGETVTICNGRLFINDKMVKPEFGFSKYENLSKITLSNDEAFVLGENMNVSIDSRHFGAVPLCSIVGKPIIRYLPFSRFGVLR